MYDAKAMHRFRIRIVVLLVFLTFQGWLGDSVNLFSTFPTMSVTGSNLLQAIAAVGPFLIVHVITALIILGMAIGVLVVSYRLPRSRGIRVASVLGLLFIASAIMGGILFVLSDYTNNGFSAQMGLSFILAYAMYFIALYYTK